MKYSLVVQSYGSIVEYSRCIFSIWSFFTNSSFAKNETQVIVFTDNPDYLKAYLDGLPIIYKQLTGENIKMMRGKIDFVHRVKIEIIKNAFQLVGGPMLYVDSDTCFIKDPSFIFRELDSGSVIMHQYEYKFSDMMLIPPPAGIPFHVFYNFVTERQFKLTNGESIKISPNQISWNAGVIALLPEHQKYLSDILKLTDDFYPETNHHGCEQYAFNIILGNKLRIKTCSEAVFHYWPVIQKRIADIYISNKITASWSKVSINQKIEDMKNWSQAIPIFIFGHFLWVRNMAIQNFHSNNFKVAWSFAFRALIRKPFDRILWCDLVYHFKRNLIYLLKKCD